MHRPFALAALLALALAPALPAPAAAQDGGGAGRAGEMFEHLGGSITINDRAWGEPGTTEPGLATPYPAAIEVRGIPSSVADVDVTLFGLTHPDPVDIDILLVGPRGQSTVLLSDVGHGAGAVDVHIRFDDESGSQIGTGALPSGRFIPTNLELVGDPFPDAFPGAPPRPATGPNALSVFDDTNPNGTWRLYVVDDYPGAAGRLAGWILEFSYSANASPKARDDAYRVAEDRTLRKGDPGVLGNDVDPDDDPLTATLVSGPTKGTLTLKPDGSFAYKPRRNFHGTDRFVYEITDVQGFTDQATVTITVLARPG